MVMFPHEHDRLIYRYEEMAKESGESDADHTSPEQAARKAAQQSLSKVKAAGIYSQYAQQRTFESPFYKETVDLGTFRLRTTGEGSILGIMFIPSDINSPTPIVMLKTRDVFIQTKHDTVPLEVLSGPNLLDTLNRLKSAENFPNGKIFLSMVEE
ncbi:MAG: hypothetical protein K940chlam7_01116 [Chlamydiae bacterium]|nr:hypothetical protein [Chlamydiota bacterium]